MKKNFIVALIVIIFAVGGWYLYSNHVPAYVSTVSGLEAEGYAGSDYYVKPPDLVAFDTNKLTGITLTTPGQKLFDARFDHTYAFLDFDNNAVRLINLKNQTVENFSFPETPAYVIDYIWIGDRMLVHYFSANGLTAAGISKDTPREDHFYFLNPDTKKYTSIKVDTETSQYTAHDYRIYFLKKSDAGNNFAVAVCSGRNFLGECNRYGYSLSDGTTIKKIFDLKGVWTWGWKDNNFFVKNNNKVYIVDPKGAF